MKVDGAEVRPEGRVLDACLAAGADVPHFCDAPPLSVRGHCRACMVEMDGRLVAACSTPARAGADVRTDTPRLRAYRRDLGELMRAECTPGGPVAETLAAWGVDGARYAPAGGKTARVQDTSHAYLRLDLDACILCRRCERACAEIQGQFVYSAANRGAATELTWGGGAFADTDCTSCGACVATCPTGAISDVDAAQAAAGAAVPAAAAGAAAPATGAPAAPTAAAVPPPVGAAPARPSTGAALSRAAPAAPTAAPAPAAPAAPAATPAAAAFAPAAPATGAPAAPTAAVVPPPPRAPAGRAVLAHAGAAPAPAGIRTTCGYCGVGCQLDVVAAADGGVARIDGVDAAVNHGHLCVKGRYAHGFVDHPDRLRTPLVRREGVLVPATWDEAITRVVEGLHGRSVAGLSSSRATNEENYLFQKWLRAGLGSNDVDCCARVCHAPSAAGMRASIGTGAATNSFADVDDADLLMVVGANVTEAHPVVGARIKEAALRGAALLVVDPRRTELAAMADLHLQLRPGTNVPLLQSLAHVLVREDLVDHAFLDARVDGWEGFRAAIDDHSPERWEPVTGVPAALVRAAARRYAAAARPMMAHGLGITEHRQGSDSVSLLCNLALLVGAIGRPGVGVNPLRGQNNVQGSADMGAQPDHLPGYQRVDDPAARARVEAVWGRPIPPTPGRTIPRMYEAMEAGDLQALIIFGEDVVQTDPDSRAVRHALGRLDFLCVMELFLTETAKLADVVLPGASFLEKDGTFTNGERRVQRVRAVVPPVAGRADWETLLALMAATGLPQPFRSPADIMDEIAAVTPLFAGVTYDRLDGDGLQWPVPAPGHPGTPILHAESFPGGRAKLAVVTWQPSPELALVPLRNAALPALLSAPEPAGPGRSGADLPSPVGRREPGPAPTPVSAVAGPPPPGGGTPSSSRPLLPEGLAHPDDPAARLRLVTGRTLVHYNAGSMTRRTANVTLQDRDWLEIHPADAALRGISGGDPVVIESANGVARATARVTDRVAPGTVFLSFHFPETETNAATGAGRDTVTDCPEYKLTAVRVSVATARPAHPPDAAPALAPEPALAPFPEPERAAVPAALPMPGARPTGPARRPSPPARTTMPFCFSFDQLGMADLPRVGGKNAALGELVRSLVPLGVRVSPGFAVTADAYDAVLDQLDTRARLRDTLAGLDVEDVEGLARRAAEARAIIRRAGLPDAVAQDIREAYRALGGEVAVRSSATAEDLPDASFAGQQETFLNVAGEDAVLDACLGCFASLFTARAVSYRAAHGYDHLAVKLSVGVQRMVRSDIGAAGVIFTLDPESGFRDVVVVTSAWGLGEAVVSGRVDPDEMMVFKGTLGTAAAPIVRRRLGAKERKVVYAASGTRTVDVPPEDRARFSLTDADALQLAKWAVQVERAWAQRTGKPSPMDLEWAKDGRTGELYVLQARPETVRSQEDVRVIERWKLQGDGEVLLRGPAVGTRIGAGPARVVRSVDELASFRAGDVLVAEMTDPDWVPVMKRAAAIITDGGGRTCHAAIVSRELGVPCIVGTHEATKRLADGAPVTVDCSGGAEGRVLAGRVPFTREVIDASALPKPRTRVMVNLADPGRAFAVAALPVDGVGLAREEFVIAESIGVHPCALLEPDRVDEPTRATIARRAQGYPSPVEWYVARLAEGLGTIAAAFHPRPVIVRFSDFKTNEYARLLGGAAFEPKEENPMIGWRGASRYADPRFRAAFGLECRAVRRVREDMGLTNLEVMVPFCRTAAEGRRVLAAMAEEGLKRSPDGPRVWVMCEIPANVVAIDQFAAVFDGFSIGSNDLTQLVLGVDRDNSDLAATFDERDEAVTRTIAAAIRGAHAAGRPIGICGQAPSDFPEIARFLVAEGIDSVSLDPSAVLRILPVLVDAERVLEAAT